MYVCMRRKGSLSLLLLALLRLVRRVMQEGKERKGRKQAMTHVCACRLRGDGPSMYDARAYVRKQMPTQT
jgi:hypothetical protein